MNSERGFAILLVMFIVALATIIVVNMAFSTSLSSRTNAMAVRGVQAEYLLKSALNLARVLIQKDTSPEDAPQDPWGPFLNGAPIPPEYLGLGNQNVRLELEVRPEDSKIRIDQLGQGLTEQFWAQVLYNLFKQLGFDEDQEQDQTGLFKERVFNSAELVGNLIDYMDADKESFPGSAFARGIESEVEEGIFPNEPLHSIDELRNVPGFSPARLQKLSPFITTRGKYRININSAPREILLAMDSDIDEDMVTRILELRATRPFSRPGSGSETNWVDDLREIVGQDIFSRIQSRVDVESSWYQVIAKAEYAGNARYFLRAVIYEEGRGASDTPLPRINSIELY